MTINGMQGPESNRSGWASSRKSATDGVVRWPLLEHYHSHHSPTMMEATAESRKKMTLAIWANYLSDWYEIKWCIMSTWHSHDLAYTGS